MEDIRLFVFNNEVKLSEKKWNNIISTKETCVQVFSKMWKIEVIYKIERIGERVKLCSTSILVLKNGKTKLFYTYCIYLLIK